ncbi:MAG: MBL fold metallo-hydrolase [Candidatus Dormibacteria bacterium]
MELAVLGSGSAFADTGHQAGYVVDRKLLLDCGAPAPLLLSRMGIDLAEIETVVISHLHSDHVGQLPMLLVARAVTRPEAPPLLVLGPRDLADHLRRLGELSLGAQFWNSFYSQHTPILREVAEGRIEELGSHRLEFIEVEHVPQLHCLAIRVETQEVSLGYSGDTTLCPGIRRLAGSVDHLLCECTGWSKPAPIHLWKEEVELLMREFPRTSFLLTHLSERKPVGGALLAFDGLRLRLTRPPAD